LNFPTAAACARLDITLAKAASRYVATVGYLILAVMMATTRMVMAVIRHVKLKCGTVALMAPPPRLLNVYFLKFYNLVFLGWRKLMLIQTKE